MGSPPPPRPPMPCRFGQVFLSPTTPRPTDTPTPLSNHPSPTTRDLNHHPSRFEIATTDNDFPPYGTPTLMPFGYFYDPDYLIEWCKNPPPPARKCSVAKELPPHLAPACLTQLQHSWQAHESVRRRPDTGEKDVIKYDGNCPAVGNLTNALLMWTDAYNVACVSSQCTYYLQDHGDDAKFVKLRPGFKVSQVGRPGCGRRRGRQPAAATLVGCLMQMAFTNACVCM